MLCPQCGLYELSGSAEIGVQQFDQASRSKLSAWVRENNPSLISTYDTDAIATTRPPSLVARADRMLRFLHSKFAVGKSFRFDTLSVYPPLATQVLSHGLQSAANPLIAVGWNNDAAEARYMVQSVLYEEMGLLALVQDPNGQAYVIGPKGLLRLEQAPNAVSSIGFCAMWFSEEVQRLYDKVLEPAIRDAGYEPLRIDSKQHNNKIDDEIVASIRSARFVVADYTGERGGVYYEAGFAHGLGLPVVFMAQEGTTIHFDTRQYNTIFWKAEDFADARERLKNRILATLGRGPKASN